MAKYRIRRSPGSDMWWSNPGSGWVEKRSSSLMSKSKAEEVLEYICKIRNITGVILEKPILHKVVKKINSIQYVLC